MLQLSCQSRIAAIAGDPCGRGRQRKPHVVNVSRDCRPAPDARGGRRVQRGERAKEAGLGARVGEVAPVLFRAFERFGQHGQQLLDGGVVGNGGHGTPPGRIDSLIH